jgi:hypothetical protein
LVGAGSPLTGGLGYPKNYGKVARLGMPIPAGGDVGDETNTILVLFGQLHGRLRDEVDG